MERAVATSPQLTDQSDDLPCAMPPKAGEHGCGDVGTAARELLELVASKPGLKVSRHTFKKRSGVLKDVQGSRSASTAMDWGRLQEDAEAAGAYLCSLLNFAQMSAVLQSLGGPTSQEGDQEAKSLELIKWVCEGAMPQHTAKHCEALLATHLVAI
jgi:hypothetical protein